MDAGRLEEARILLEACLLEAPDHLPSRFDLGVCYLRMQLSARAEGMLRSVTALDPLHVGARLRLGDLLVAQGRSDEALTEYRAVLTHDPANPEARRGIHGHPNPAPS
ncbi:tetratricopeptide repeat protein [Nonomuraea sp. NPDC049152]|uniref:tetratricopeptide repeat protein n=1 Tax=Nonomuraea sp. NPDC049152 TaxID=3154350 RepID=UPI0033DEC85F